MKTQTVNPLVNYLYDANVSDKIYITINKDKIEKNCKNWIDYTADIGEIEYSNYCYAVYEIEKYTILTFMEGKGSFYSPKYELIINSQFLFISNELSEDLEISLLTKYVSYEIANEVLGYFSS